MLLLFRRDGPVEHPVDVAADGGHGGFQLVRDVCDEFLSALLGFFQRIRHGVEGVRQIDDLLAAAFGDRHAGIELATAKAPGRVRDLCQRLRLLVRQKRRCGQRQHQHDDRHIEKQGRTALHEIRDLRHVGGDDDIADRLVRIIGDNGPARNIAPVVMDAAERPDAERFAVRVNFGDEIRIDLLADMFTVKLVARAQHDEAIFIADQRLGLADVGKQGQTQPEVPVFLQLTRRVIRLGQRGNGGRVGAERLFFVVFQIPQHQEPERDARKDHTDQQQRRNEGKLPAERCFHGYRTSNL